MVNRKESLLVCKNTQGHFTSLRNYQRYILKQILKTFLKNINPTAINIQKISLAREYLHSLYCPIKLNV